jgi:hypothetical protein
MTFTPSCVVDTVWSQRQAYDKARSIKQAQDDYCEKALEDKWEGLGTFPEELQWEALVEVLRGHVKVCVSVLALVLLSLKLITGASGTNSLLRGC